MEGRARIFLAGSLAFFALYAYFEMRYGDGDPTMLVFGLGNLLVGIAEFLPERRQRWVNVLLSAAVGVFALVAVGALARLLT
ncbi:hypothetical protein NDI76_08060 [Halogeometricum sp. S1BR25-6]|uniref:Uncharacterized protein n=1 Tax=Halogeometricum salsisoli TaxID=2950536 RepID=A0ABU2GD66_9EURY|nr:hypothetical protein [Halogeometricum sp. S1BR25-6]MDS0298694.1 hypothetical protein [Halogeometricum sp. S1BR25-6]